MTLNASDSCQLLTQEQAADILQISPSTLQHLRVSGRKGRAGPPWIKMGKSVRYRRSDLDAWIENQVVRPSASTPKIGRPRKTERASAAPA